MMERTVMRKLLIGILVSVLMVLAGAASAGQALVDVAWVKERIGKPGVAFLDVRGEIRDVTALCGVSRIGDRDWNDTRSTDRCARCVKADEAMRRKAGR